MDHLPIGPEMLAAIVEGLNSLECIQGLEESVRRQLVSDTLDVLVEVTPQFSRAAGASTLDTFLCPHCDRPIKVAVEVTVRR